MLKGDRNEHYDNIQFFSTQTGERGGMAWHNTSTTGVGASYDDANNTVLFAGTASGSRPAGLLLNDVVSLDLTRQRMTYEKDEVQLGGKVTLLRHGVVTTNRIVAGQVPTAGQDGYYNDTGNLTTVDTGSGKVGKFLSGKDSDGFASFEVLIR